MHLAGLYVKQQMNTTPVEEQQLMNAPALALLVVVWSGHDLNPMVVDRVECERAVDAVKTAVHIRDEKYAMQSNVSAYCIAADTVAAETVSELLAPPKPSPRPASVPLTMPPTANKN